MTDSTQIELPQPGWYIDPSSGRRRWWNGIAWTGEYDDTAGVGNPVGFGQHQMLSSSTSVNPWPIWVLVLLPLLPLLPLLTVDFATYFRDVLTASEVRAVIPVPSGITTANLINLATYPATVVLAYLDWRALAQRGVVRPFHWAWAFVPFVLVYLIGRSVVLKRRVGRGTSPLWIYLLISVGGGVVEGIAVGNAVASVLAAGVPTT